MNTGSSVSESEREEREREREVRMALSLSSGYVEGKLKVFPIRQSREHGAELRIETIRPRQRSTLTARELQFTVCWLSAVSLSAEPLRSVKSALYILRCLTGPG